MPQDIGQLAQALIDKHARKTERLAGVLRGTARTHYVAGISDCLRMMQEASVAASATEGLQAQQPAISGPLGVQASHAFSSEEPSE
jgi:hypothetical protein